MISTASLEEAVLALLAFSNETAPVIALKITNASLFTNRTNQKIAQACLDYIQKYNQSPGGQLEYLLEGELRRGEDGKLLGQTLEILSNQISQIQPDFVLAELDRYIQIQTLTKSLQDAQEALIQGNLEEAQEALSKQSLAPKNTSSPLWLKRPKDALSFLDKLDNDEYFPTGIKVLDDRGIRLDRKIICVMIAAAGKGKSWFLVEAGKANLQHHHKVLHITLEMSREKTMRRYIQSIFALTVDEMKTMRVPYFERSAEGASSIEFRELTRDSVLNKRSEIARKLADMESFPDLLIQEFPPNFLSSDHLMRYIDNLEQKEGFKPDVLIIDYADLCKIDAASLRIDTGRLYRDLRAIAVIKNIALVSATQGNRESDIAKLVGSSNVSEDWSKIGTCDGIFTYSQTLEEQRLGLARIFVPKYRDAGDKILALISQAYPIGQFAVDSVFMDVNLSNAVKQFGEKE